MLHSRENVQTFFVGGALGVDMWAGEQLLALKEKSGYENIEIIVAIPFVGHGSKWPEQSQKRLKSLIQKATNCIVVSQEANTASYKNATTIWWIMLIFLWGYLTMQNRCDLVQLRL